MKIGFLCFVLIVLVISSGFFLSTAKAASWPKLPSVSVTMKVVNGTISYYTATLSNVSAGYDVANKAYPDWCVDRRYTTVRNTSIQILLYSSLALPANLSSQKWDRVNYILNHKQGDMKDVQDAIWYFVKMGSDGWWNGSTPSATSQAIVKDALAQGTGYAPGPGQLLAVICYPQTTATQTTVIEIEEPTLPIATVGGYSYAIEKTNSFGYLMPCLGSTVILGIFLVGFKRKTWSRARRNSS
jgi:hypothetical protein